MKTVEKAAQGEEERRTYVTSLVSEFKREKDCVARGEKNRIDEHSEDSEAVVEWRKALDTLKDQLRDKKGSLRQVLAAVTAANGKLETLRLRVEKVEAELSIV